MKQFIITEKQIGDLTAFANELPTKFGLPLLQFLEGIKNPKEESKEDK